MTKEECKVGIEVLYKGRICIITNFHFDKNGVGRIELSPFQGHYFWVYNSEIKAKLNNNE